MKRFYLSALLLGGLLMPGVAYADLLSPEAALNRAAGMTRASASQYSLAKTYNTKSGEAATYLFRDDSGAIVVSADDNAQPLLAILDNSFDGTKTNPEFDYWMGEYARQIEWIRSNSKKVAGPVAASTSRKAIGPLLSTLWDQGSPYNDLAPYHTGDKVNCFTGCVATALTQVMNYHKWPEVCTGSNKYTTGTNKFNLEENFEGLKFDWKNMADAYKGNTSVAQDDAVAELMYYVGVALWMDYGVGSQGGSGAYTENVPYVLVNNFNYDKGAHVVYRDFMPYAEWEQLVYDQLALGPVYYAGSSDDGAHAYVCDGYKDGYFHINWGWGGYQNGYYLLTAMYPGSQQGAGGSTGSYDFDQMIVADVKKPQADSKVEPLMMYTWGSWLLENDKGVSETTIGRKDQIGIAGWAQNRSIEPVSLTKGFQLENEDGVVTVLDGGHENLPRYNPYYNNQDCYFYWLAATVPASVKNGKYIVRPVYKVDGASEWELIKMPKARHQAYMMEVSDNYIKMSNAEQAEIWIENMEWDGKMVAGKSLKLKCTITNESDYDYEGCIRMNLFYGYNDYAGQCGRRFVSVPAGETVEFLYESNIMDDLKPGTYDIWIKDEASGNWVGGQNGFLTLEEAPAPAELRVQSFSFNGDTNNADNMNLDFSLRIKCQKGWFRDNFVVTIWTTGANSSYVTSATSDEVEINEGETKTVKFHGEIPDPIEGMKYIAGAWYGGTQYGQSITFTILKSDVDEVEVAEVANVEIYNMAGVKFNTQDVNELPAGIYIIRTTTTDGKTTVKKQIVK